jgi:ABC-2 type transport system permease protein
MSSSARITTPPRGGFNLRRELSAAGAIAARDVTKLLRDPIRLVGGLVFPALFIAVLGGAFASNFKSPGIDLLPFIFAGQLAQGVWQSAALGLVSILEDRENDFSQEIFVAPIGRRTILAGKILGESIVAFPQAFTVMAFGIVLGIPLTLAQIFAMVPALILVALFGASFGALIVSLLPNQRSANLLFPFIFLPQFFLAGSFNPVRNLPWYLDIASHIAPLRYAVDLIRSAYYGYPNPAVLADPAWTTGLIVILTTTMLSIGTFLFVRSERNR